MFSAFELRAWPVLGWLTVLGSISPVAAQTTLPPEWKISLNSDRHTDAVPLADLGSDDPLIHSNPRPGRNIGYIRDELRLQSSYQAWQISLLVRQSATLVTNRDSLGLVQRINRGDDFTQDAHWQTHVRYQQFAGGGLELGRYFNWGTAWQANIAVQGLSLHRWRETRVDGPASVTDGGIYAFNLRSFASNNSMEEPFQESFPSLGWGMLWSGGVSWRTEAWQIVARVEDLGWLQWKGLPQQTMWLNSQIASVDADGYLNYKPLMEGYNSQQGYTRRQNGWWTLQTQWQATPTGQLQLAARTSSGMGWLPSLSWQETLGDGFSSRVSWQTHEQRLTLGFAWQGWQLHYGSDTWNGAARSRDWGLGFGAAW
jgi:hypothetical protein